MSLQIGSLSNNHLIKNLPEEIVRNSCEWIPYESVAILPLVNKAWLHAMGYSLPQQPKPNYILQLLNRGISRIQRSLCPEKFFPLPQKKAESNETALVKQDRENRFEELELEFWPPLIAQSFRNSGIKLSKILIRNNGIGSSVLRSPKSTLQQRSLFGVNTGREIGCWSGIHLNISEKQTNQHFTLFLSEFLLPETCSRQNGIKTKESLHPKAFAVFKRNLGLAQETTYINPYRPEQEVTEDLDFMANHLGLRTEDLALDNLKWGFKLTKALLAQDCSDEVAELSSVLKGTHPKYELTSAPIQGTQKFSWPFRTDPKILSSQTEADLEPIHSSSSPVEIGDNPVPGTKKRKIESS